MSPEFDPWLAEQVRVRAATRYSDTPAQLAQRQADAAAAYEGGPEWTPSS